MSSDVNQNFVEYFSEFRNVPIEWKEAQNFLNWYLLQNNNLLNAKSIGIYSSQEIPSGKQLYLSETSYDLLRTTVNFGPLPNAGIKSVPHSIDTTIGFRLFNLYLAANDLVNGQYFCLQYYSLDAADSIRLNLDATNVNVITTADYSAYTDCYVIIEYAQGVS